MQKPRKHGMRINRRGVINQQHAHILARRLPNPLLVTDQYKLIVLDRQESRSSGDVDGAFNHGSAL